MTQEQVSLRQSVTWGAVAFGIVLAVVIGIRLDQAALAVVVGVVCGVAASIPTSLLTVLLLRRRETKNARREMTGEERRQVTQPPPMVIVAPAAASQLPQQAGWSGEYAPPSPTRRRFSVIGEEGIEDEFDVWQE